jgi:hypothetical protein
MNKFKYSLEEFLLLPDNYYEDREFSKYLLGRDWLWLYNSAKASYEQYGEDGPSVGSKVTTLFAGHGGGPGAIRTFDGVYPEDERYLLIYYNDFVHSASSIIEKKNSLVCRKYWWREILPYESEIPWT